MHFDSCASVGSSERVEVFENKNARRLECSQKHERAQNSSRRSQKVLTRTAELVDEHVVGAVLRGARRGGDEQE